MLDVQKQEYNKKGKYITNVCHFVFFGKQSPRIF